MNDILFEIILAIIPIIGTIITVYLVPFIKEKVGNEKLAKYEYWTSLAVNAAEMIWKESGQGKNKKEFVVDYLDRLLNSNGTVLTEEQINVLIEACVNEMNSNK